VLGTLTVGGSGSSVFFGHSEGTSSFPRKGSHVRSRKASNMYQRVWLAGRAALRPTAGGTGSGSGNRVRKRHRRPVAPDLQVPGAQRLHEGAAIVDQCGQGGRGGLGGRFGPVCGPENDLEPTFGHLSAGSGPRRAATPSSPRSPRRRAGRTSSG
jgi:hypothetical protein